jgi:hypothetical protein
MKLWLTSLAAAALTALALAPVAVPAGPAIAINPAYGPPVSSATGVAFDVTTGGGNRDYASVEVACTVGADTVYSTVLNVVVPAKGTATSQTIYPPASSCVANLVKQMSIGKSRVLGTVSFEVS